MIALNTPVDDCDGRLGPLGLAEAAPRRLRLHLLPRPLLTVERIAVGYCTRRNRDTSRIAHGLVLLINDQTRSGVLREFCPQLGPQPFSVIPYRRNLFECLEGRNTDRFACLDIGGEMYACDDAVLGYSISKVEQWSHNRVDIRQILLWDIPQAVCQQVGHQISLHRVARRKARCGRRVDHWYHRRRKLRWPRTAEVAFETHNDVLADATADAEH